MDFNDTRETYRSTIEQTIAFAGKGLDFFTSVKADYLARLVRRELPDLKRPQLLDIGCGHGYIHPELLQQGFEITGVEVAADVLDIARQANPGANYLSYEGRELPVADESVDVALAICVMHHVSPSQWPAFTREMRRVLRPGGLAVVFEHNPWNPLTRYVVASNEIDRDAVLLSCPTLRALMENASFDRVGARNILFTPLASPLFREIDRRLGWCPLGAQYFVYGRAE